MLHRLLRLCLPAAAALPLLLPLNANAQRDPNTEASCYSRLNHDSVRACIKEQSVKASKALETAEKTLTGTIQKELHANRAAATRRFTQSNARYRQYRQSQCEFQSEAASAKKSAPDRQMLCTIALDAQRTRELNTTTETLRGREK